MGKEKDLQTTYLNYYYSTALANKHINIQAAFHPLS